MAKKQVKKITIELKETENGQEVVFHTENIKAFEALGLLRLYEQKTSIEILQRMGSIKASDDKSTHP